MGKMDEEIYWSLVASGLEPEPILNRELSDAVKKGDKTKIRELVNLPDVSGRTPLMRAIIDAKDPDLALINTLLENGADVNVFNSEGQPFITANFSKLKSNPKLLELILNKGNLNPFLTGASKFITPLILTRVFYWPDAEKKLQEYETKYKKELEKTNPELLKQIEDYFNWIQYIKEKGHALGIDATIDIKNPMDGETVKIAMAGNYNEPSTRHLTRLVSAYHAMVKEDASKQIIARHLDSLEEAYQVLHDYNRLGKRPKELLDRIRNHPEKPTILTAGWPDHTLSIAIYGNYIILSNRGAGGRGKEGFGIQIYKFPKELKEGLTEKIIQDLNDQKASEKTILDRINQLIPDENLVEEIESEDQKHGTCSFVNHKSIMKALLYLMEGKRLASEPGSPKEGSKIADDAMSFAKKEYKNFTRWLRNNEIKDIVAEYEGGSMPKEILDKIVEAYLHQHFFISKTTKDPKKREAELDWAYELLQAMDEGPRIAMINRLLESGNTLLSEAKSHSNQKLAAYIRQYLSPNAAMIDAVEDGKSDQIRELLQKGVDPNLRVSGKTIFHQALKSKLPTRIIKDMLDHGANLTIMDYSDEEAPLTPLMLAALKRDNVDTLQLLISKGAEVDQVNGLGDTALMIACVVRNNGRNVEFLIKQGADLNHTNLEGQSALDVATVSNNKAIVSLLEGAVKNLRPFAAKDQEKSPKGSAILFSGKEASPKAAKESQVIVEPEPPKEKPKV